MVIVRLLALNPGEDQRNGTMVTGQAHGAREACRACSRRLNAGVPVREVVRAG